MYALRGLLKRYGWKKDTGNNKPEEEREEKTRKGKEKNQQSIGQEDTGKSCRNRGGRAFGKGTRLRAVGGTEPGKETGNRFYTLDMWLLGVGKEKNLKGKVG